MKNTQKELLGDEKTLIIYGILGWGVLLILFIVISFTYVDSGKIGDSFGMINSLISLLTLIYLYRTFREQKIINDEQREKLEEQSKIARNSQFRDYIRLQIEWFKGAIKSLKAQGHNQGYRTFEGEDALTLIKFSAISIDGVVYQGFDKKRWLTQEGNFKLTGILKSISYFEEYIDENYKGEDTNRKKYYKNLIKNEISPNLYELLMEVATAEEKELYTLK